MFSGRRYLKWRVADIAKVKRYFQGTIYSCGDGNKGKLPSKVYIFAEHLFRLLIYN